jgi:hypothetical protein
MSMTSSAWRRAAYRARKSRRQSSRRIHSGKQGGE